MFAKFRKLSLRNCAILGLIIFFLTVTISLLNSSDTKMWLNKMRELLTTDVKYEKIAPTEFSEDVLDSHFESCFFPNTEKHPLVKLLLEFSKFSHHFEIETVLIEPSLLFCILSTDLQNLLRKRNFTALYRSSDHVLTMGIFEKDVIALENEEVRDQLAKIGFQIEIVEHPIVTWMKPQTFSNRTMSTSHVFLRKDKLILHLVVFFERANFLWHAALSPRPPIKDGLLFMDADSAFDNFIPVSLGFKDHHLKNVNIPNNPASFLYQIEASRFLECNETIVNSFKAQHISDPPIRRQDPNFSEQAFNQRLRISIQELKLNIDPLLIRFWLWSGTLLGWHRECGVIPYTTDADFATWDTYGVEIDKLIDKLKKNEHLTATEKWGFFEQALEYKFNCHGLSVDLFFIYKLENGTWCGSHGYKGTGYYMKYYYPFFSLCSAELLGERVNIPCEPEGVVLADYGEQWMKPVSKWDYQRSVHNRGPNIYWEKSLVDKVYTHF